ncbi:hypothetical protein PV704_40310, partial [Streptomyces scabiei]|nr:hypothetical protein [Streptomyces scabiei]
MGTVERAEPATHPRRRTAPAVLLVCGLFLAAGTACAAPPAPPRLSPAGQTGVGQPLCRGLD